MTLWTWFIRVDKLLLKAEAYIAGSALLVILISACFLFMLAAGIIVRLISGVQWIILRRPGQAA